MTERLLQYIWQFQHYNKSELSTLEEEPLQVIHPGIINQNQGPDFLDAKIRVGKTFWAGSIELHIFSSGWRDHRHTADKNFKNVILHVVWQHDIDLDLAFPTLVLEDKVPKILLKKYGELMNKPRFIPCEKNIHLVNEITWTSWKDRLMAERLTQKTGQIFKYLGDNNNHWEESLWWLLAKNFGSTINGGAFEKLAQSVSLNMLSKHKNQVHQLEALLFGQAGLLETNFEESYPSMLQKEYRFLKSKYRLKKINEPLLFLRMRPSNFPTIRLAQLAMLIHESMHLLSRIRSCDTLPQVKSLFNVTANDYWHYHYMFDETTAFKKKTLGRQMTGSILINAIIPVIFAYGTYHNEEEYKHKALKWMGDISPEKNTITLGFEALGVSNKNALDSQALIHLKKEYCSKRRCLDCSIGNKLMRSP